MVILRLALLGLLFCTPAVPAAAQEMEPPSGSPRTGSPRQVVETLHAALLDVMKDAKALGYRGRYRRLDPTVRAAYHWDGMVKVIVGHHWRKFTDAQKRALVGAFTRMTVATYANRFDGYGGEIFRTRGAAVHARGTALVGTEIVKNNGEKVALDYRLRKIDDRWGVVDIYLKGTISEVATKRSEYSSIIRRKGLDALLNQIDKKIRLYEEG